MERTQESPADEPIKPTTPDATVTVEVFKTGTQLTSAVKLHEPEKRELTPELAKETLEYWETRFKKITHLHKEAQREKVKAALAANKEALWTIYMAAKAGHDPDVFDADEWGFYLGTCSAEVPQSSVNCVYDQAAADSLAGSGEKFNSNAVAMARAIGFELMAPAKYQDVLQKKGEFDLKTSSYLATPPEVREKNLATSGYNDGKKVFVDNWSANAHGPKKGWRGMRKVNWAAEEEK